MPNPAKPLASSETPNDFSPGLPIKKRQAYDYVIIVGLGLEDNYKYYEAIKSDIKLAIKDMLIRNFGEEIFNGKNNKQVNQIINRYIPKILIIGNGKDDISLEEIREKSGLFDEQTGVILSAHGCVSNQEKHKGKHIIQLNKLFVRGSADIINILYKQYGVRNLILNSCYSAQALSDIKKQNLNGLNIIADASPDEASLSYNGIKAVETYLHRVSQEKIKTGKLVTVRDFFAGIIASQIFATRFMSFGPKGCIEDIFSNRPDVILGPSGLDSKPQNYLKSILGISHNKFTPLSYSMLSSNAEFFSREQFELEIAKLIEHFEKDKLKLYSSKSIHAKTKAFSYFVTETEIKDTRLDEEFLDILINIPTAYNIIARKILSLSEENPKNIIYAKKKVMLQKHYNLNKEALYKNDKKYIWDLYSPDKTNIIKEIIFALEFDDRQNLSLILSKINKILSGVVLKEEPNIDDLIKYIKDHMLDPVASAAQKYEILRRLIILLPENSLAFITSEIISEFKDLNIIDDFDELVKNILAEMENIENIELFLMWLPGDTKISRQHIKNILKHVNILDFEADFFRRLFEFKNINLIEFLSVLHDKKILLETDDATKYANLQEDVKYYIFFELGEKILSADPDSLGIYDYLQKECKSFFQGELCQDEEDEIKATGRFTDGVLKDRSERNLIKVKFPFELSDDVCESLEETTGDLVEGIKFGLIKIREENKLVIIIDKTIFPKAVQTNGQGLEPEFSLKCLQALLSCDRKDLENILDKHRGKDRGSSRC